MEKQKRKNKPHTEERKSNISKALKGRFAGKNHPMYGKNHTEESKEKIRSSAHHKNLKGLRMKDKNSNWKGDDAKYSSIHGWIINNFGKPEICEICNSKNKIEWSNKNHKYNRNRKDWQKLCRSCHRGWDFENNR